MRLRAEGLRRWCSQLRIHEPVPEMGGLREASGGHIQLLKRTRLLKHIQPGKLLWALQRVQRTR